MTTSYLHRLPMIAASLSSRTRRIAFLALLSTLAAWAHVVEAETVFEYINLINGRRVLLTVPAEIKAVVNGEAGPGWVDSGVTFTIPAAGSQGSSPVHRFYSPSANSHFYTASNVEYNALRQPGSGWNYVGVEFNAQTPVDNFCPATSRHPVYRLFNARDTTNGNRHRYTPDPDVAYNNLPAGWVNEGVAFCAINYTRLETFRFQLGWSTELEHLASPLCGESSQARTASNSCVSVINQPLPKFVLTTSALGDGPYSTGSTPLFGVRTGLTRADVFTASATGDPYEVATHSFFQRYVSLCAIQATSNCFLGLNPIGVHVSGVDRMAATTSVNPTMQFPTATPASVGSEIRVRPWLGTPRTLQLSFSLGVASLTRNSTDAHAYGHPSIALYDTVSGRRILINVLAYSTDPAPTTADGDYAGIDADTGAVIVSTTFRANPAFGVNKSDAYANCLTSENMRCAGRFAFVLRPTDMAFVVAKARKLDPRLSPAIADYAIDQFNFKNEVFGFADIGLNLDLFKLEIRLTE
ncbi:MAG: hypothetical protein ABI905_16905 [Betaproteobacteria bacterium]